MRLVHGQTRTSGTSCAKAAAAFDKFEKAQMQKAQRKLDRMRERKNILRAKQGSMVWTRREREWSSAAEPQLSPITQSDPDEEAGSRSVTASGRSIRTLRAIRN